jgi:hypothetical protein
MITFYPRALLKAALVLGAVAGLLALGLDVRWGALAIAATAIVDALSFLIPLVFGARYRSEQR